MGTFAKMLEYLRVLVREELMNEKALICSKDIL